MLAGFLGVFFFIPIFATKVGLGASWMLALTVQALWIALLVIFGLSINGSSGEKVGWPLIFGMMLTIPVNCAAVLLLMMLGAR